jgi:hypothetical protein
VRDCFLAGARRIREAACAYITEQQQTHHLGTVWIAFMRRLERSNGAAEITLVQSGCARGKRPLRAFGRQLRVQADDHSGDNYGIE